MLKKAVKVPQRDVPVYAETDVLVVGGGPAGIGAAVAAARQGVRVMVLEKRAFLGGNITASYVESCNHFYHGTSFKEDGLYREIKDVYVDQFGRSDDIREDFSPHRFSSEYLKVFLDSFLTQAGIDVKFHAFVNEVICKDNKIDYVIIQTKKGPLAVKAKMIVDATGDGDVAYSAGVPFDQGKQGSGLCQPGTLNFRITGIDVGKIESQPNGLSSISKLFKQSHMNGKTDISCKRRGMALGRLTPAGQLSYINFCDVYMIDPTDIEGQTKGEVEGRKIVMELFHYLKNNIDGMQEIELTSIAPEMGYRDSRRIHGYYTLTTDDIEHAQSFEDVIAVYPRFYDMLALDGDWSKGRGYGTDAVYTPLQNGVSYQIPYRCLLPVVVDNLLVAGRCISADHVAESTLRAISACMLTGQAAGSGAALALQSNVKPSKVDISTLQGMLKKQGVMLP